MVLAIIPAPYSIAYSEIQKGQIKDAAMQDGSNTTDMILGPKGSTNLPTEKVSPQT